MPPWGLVSCRSVRSSLPESVVQVLQAGHQFLRKWLIYAVQRDFGAAVCRIGEYTYKLSLSRLLPSNGPGTKRLELFLGVSNHANGSSELGGR